MEEYKKNIQNVIDELTEPYSDAVKQLESLQKIIQTPLSAINK